MNRLKQLFSVVLLAASLAAQEKVPRPTKPLHVPDFQAPISNSSATKALWSLGSRFKVAFDEGFAFYSREEGMRDTAPLRWETSDIAVGGVDLAKFLYTARRHSKWRCEHQHGPGVVEIYDVTPQGVEQSFRIEKRPSTAGDLTIVGRVTTALRAEPMLDKHAEIVFCDSNSKQPITSYGKTFALDAKGDKVNLTSSWDGESITLTVPGAWLARAEFPVVVDPLVSSKILQVVPAKYHMESRGLAIGIENTSTTHNVLVAYSRYIYEPPTNEKNIGETYLLLCNSDFTDPRVVYARTDPIAPAAPIRQDNLAPVHGAGKWVVSLWGTRDVYIHPFGDTTLNGGTVLPLPKINRQRLAYPVVGGTAGGSSTRALIAFDVTSASPGPIDRWPGAVVLDAEKEKFVTNVINLRQSHTHCCEGWRLAISQVNSGTPESPWIVGWIDRPTAPHAKPRVRGALVAPDGNVKPYADFGTTTDGRWTLRVAGRDGRYMMAFAHQVWHDVESLGRAEWQIEIQRFNWARTANQPTVGNRKTVVPLKADTSLILRDIAFDAVSSSQWCVAYTEHYHELKTLPHTGPIWGKVARIDSNGLVEEEQTLWTALPPQRGSFGVAVCFDPVSNSFPIAYTRTHGFNYSVRGTKLFEAPSVTPFGVGKGLVEREFDPLAKYLLFKLSKVNPAQPAVLMLGTDRQALDLTKRGMPGSYLYVGGKVESYPTKTNLRGEAQIRIPITKGTRYFGQWMFRDPTAKTPAQRATSRGFEVITGRAP